jgi:hypothetical protein
MAPGRVDNPNADNAAYPIHTRRKRLNVDASAAVLGPLRGGNVQRHTIEDPGWWRADVGAFKNLNIYDRVNPTGAWRGL